MVAIIALDLVVVEVVVVVVVVVIVVAIIALDQTASLSRLDAHWRYHT